MYSTSNDQIKWTGGDYLAFFLNKLVKFKLVGASTANNAFFHRSGKYL